MFRAKCTFVLLLVSMSSLLTGCMSSTYQPIAPIYSNQEINRSMDKPASVVWVPGSMTTQDGQVRYMGAGAGTGVAGVAFDLLFSKKIEQSAERGDQIYFGGQDQAIFMQSLREYLDENNVFKDVQLATKRGHEPKVVYITVRFDSTRVGEALYRFPITLDATLLIDYNKHHFSRHYFIHEESKRPNGNEDNYFVYHSNRAAKRLMHDVIKGIRTWLKTQPSATENS